MQFLSQEAMIELVSRVSEENILLAQKAIPLPGGDARPDWIEYGVKEGFYLPVTMYLDELPSALIFYSVADNQAIHVHACHSLRPGVDIFDYIEVAFRRIALQNNCKFVEWVSKRAGAIEKARSHGYEICGVVVRRALTDREMKAKIPT